MTNFVSPNQPATSEAEIKMGLLSRMRKTVVEYPVILLIGVLFLLVFTTGMIQPNYLSVSGIRNTLLQAAPLGILAGWRP